MCIYHNLFIYLNDYGYLSYFHLGAIKNKAATNNCVQVFFFFFYGHVNVYKHMVFWINTWSAILGNMVKCLFTL